MVAEAPPEPVAPPAMDAVVLAARCWSGALLAVVATASATARFDPSVPLGALGVAAAAALLGTLVVLVGESLVSRAVTPEGHTMIAGLALGVVVGLFTLSPGLAVVSGLLGTLLALIGREITSGAVRWRRGVVALAVVAVVSWLLSLLVSI